MLIDKKKLDKQERANLERLSSNIKSQFLFGHLKTYSDLLKAVGYSNDHINNTWFESERNAPLNIRTVKDYLDDRRIELETRLWLRDNPPLITDVNGSIQEPTILHTPSEPEIAKVKYDLIPCKLQKCHLYAHQEPVVAQIYHYIMVEKRRAIQLVGGTGVGKTFVYGAIFARLKENNFHLQAKCISPWPYMIVTAANIVEQTERVFQDSFSLKSPKDILIINIEQLRSKAGELFVEEEVVIENGIERTVWKWRDHLNPIAVGWDECQKLKNYGTQQHSIGCSFNDIPIDKGGRTFQLYGSATPGFKVNDFKCFCVATHKKTKRVGVVETELTNTNWPLYAKSVAHPAEPHESIPAAVDRLMDDMDSDIVRIKNVPYQFKPDNKILTIDFITTEGKAYYDTAVERYQQKMAKAAKEQDGGIKNIIELTALLQYKIAAESNPDRIKFIGDRSVEHVNNGFAVGMAFSHKISIIKMVEYLNKEHKVPRDKISLIWGGGKTESVDDIEAAMKKAGMNMTTDEIEILKKAGVTLADLSIDTEKLDPQLRLGPQSRKERQKEIDRFQSGKTLFCLYTFKSGGVGLSLHHTDESTKEKVRHKKSGFAFEEDIAKIPTRPRKGYIATTWSPIEAVQGSGRLPRINSLSNTEQFFVFFKNTVEAKIAQILSLRLRCLRKVIRQKESWEDLIIGGYEADDKYKQLTNVKVTKDDEDTDIVTDTEIETTEENNDN